MKIRVTFDFDDRVRRAIRAQMSDDNKPASYEDCKNWIDAIIDSTLGDVCSEYDDSEEAKNGGDS